MATDDRTELLALMKEVSYKRRKVILASGRESDFYIDVRETACRGRGKVLIGRLGLDLIEKIEKERGVRFAALAAPVLGAVPVCDAISHQAALNGRELPVIPVRKKLKDHGVGSYLVADAHYPRGMNVCVFEDVGTTGGSGVKAAKHVIDAGHIVTVIVTVVDRLEGAHEFITGEGYDHYTLLDANDFID